MCYNHTMDASEDNSKNGKQLDFLAIGDIVTDTFIKIKDAHVHCKVNSEECELCMNFGDKIPFELAVTLPAVGNSPNAAVSAARLGLKTALMTNMGDDRNGGDCLAQLEKENIDRTFIKIEKGKLTNHHYVLWYDVDRTILIKHEKYDREWPDTKEAGMYAPPKWIYLSSLGEDSLPFHAEISAYLARHPDVRLAFQPGTYQMEFSTEKLKDIYARSDAFFCNLEEASRILKTESEDPMELSKGIAKLGPKIVVISDGPKGAYMYMNEEMWSMPIYPDKTPPKERTGAGDAFSSTFTAALALGKTPLEALAWGPINSMAVVQEIGAQAGLLSREKLEEYLKTAPAGYKPIKKN